jgi:CheY-like chemotaxis protein
MPEVDGLSLCSRMLDPEHIGIDVIVMSGYSEDITAERCNSFGATYVRKGPELWNKVHTALNNIFPGMTIEARDTKPPSAAKVRERPLILVVDDDPNVGKFLTTRLRKCGVDVLFATDAKQAYQLAVREKPSVIISDYYMSVANINFLMWRLRSTPGMETLPVLAMTGAKLDPITAADLMRGQFQQRGVERIFRKPLDVDDLFTTLQKYCALTYASPQTAASQAG